MVAVAIALIAGSYLLGSLPQVYLLGRLKGVDLRQEDDLHIALWQKVSRPLGFLALSGDLAKGAIPILAGRLLEVELWALAMAGLFVVLGQMWPIFLPGSGGRGNSTALVMSLTLAPSPFLFALIPIALGAIVRTVPRFLSRRQVTSGPPSLSLPWGMITGFAVLPLASWLLHQPHEVSLGFLAVLLVIIIRRLTVGLRADLKIARSRGSLFLNRLLYDRSFI